MRLSDYAHILLDFEGVVKESKIIDTSRGQWYQVSAFSKRISSQQGSKDILLPGGRPSYQKLSREESAELSKRFFPTYTYMLLYASPKLPKVTGLQPGVPFEAQLMGLNKNCTTQDLWLDTNRIELFQWHMIG